MAEAVTVSDPVPMPEVLERLSHDAPSDAVQDVEQFIMTLTVSCPPEGVNDNCVGPTVVEHCAKARFAVAPNITTRMTAKRANV